MCLGSITVISKAHIEGVVRIGISTCPFAVSVMILLQHLGICPIVLILLQGLVRGSSSS